MIEPTTNAGQHLWQHGHPQHGFKEAIAAVEHEAVSNYIQSAYFAADLVAAMSQVTTNAEALTIAVLAKMREKGSKRETIEGAEQ
jgi:hypothetical protein